MNQNDRWPSVVENREMTDRHVQERLGSVVYIEAWMFEPRQRIPIRNTEDAPQPVMIN